MEGWTNKSLFTFKSPPKSPCWAVGEWSMSQHFILWPRFSCPNALVTSNTTPAHMHATGISVNSALFTALKPGFTFRLLFAMFKHGEDFIGNFLSKSRDINSADYRTLFRRRSASSSSSSSSLFHRLFCRRYVIFDFVVNQGCPVRCIKKRNKPDRAVSQRVLIM